MIIDIQYIIETLIHFIFLRVISGSKQEMSLEKIGGRWYFSTIFFLITDIFIVPHYRTSDDWRKYMRSLLVFQVSVTNSLTIATFSVL